MVLAQKKKLLYHETCFTDKKYVKCHANFSPKLCLILSIFVFILLCALKQLFFFTIK